MQTWCVPVRGRPQTAWAPSTWRVTLQPSRRRTQSGALTSGIWPPTELASAPPKLRPSVRRSVWGTICQVGARKVRKLHARVACPSDSMLEAQAWCDRQARLARVRRSLGAHGLGAVRWRQGVGRAAVGLGTPQVEACARRKQETSALVCTDDPSTLHAVSGLHWASVSPPTAAGRYSNSHGCGGRQTGGPLNRLQAGAPLPC